MGEKQRGTIERIAVDISYPDGSTKQRVIKGDELKRLAIIALKPDAVRNHLPNLKNRDEVLRQFEEGDDTDPTSKPALMTLYDDGIYSMECRPSDHHPPESR